MTRKIITEYVYPPIPIRQFDWSAVFDDYDGAPDSNCPHGTGPTEEAAIADLLEQVAEDAAEGQGFALLSAKEPSSNEDGVLPSKTTSDRGCKTGDGRQ